MAETPRVFISATTGDLGSYRAAVADALNKHDVHPVVQDHFPPDYRSVREMLRARIETCHAVICLIGRGYGSEPKTQDENEPRRSYTQLEYEIALDLKKPVFVFFATEECQPDSPITEPEDRLGLQLEHAQRVWEHERLRFKFASREGLKDQVGRLRFDPAGLERGVVSRFSVLLCAELVDAGESRGDQARARGPATPCLDLFRRSFARYHGKRSSQDGGRVAVGFDNVEAAVHAALELHRDMRAQAWGGGTALARVGVHVGRILHYPGLEPPQLIQTGPVLTTCVRLCGLALGGQTLLSGDASNAARPLVRGLAAIGGVAQALSWNSYGHYQLRDVEGLIEVCEVGAVGQAPLSAPPDTADAVSDKATQDRKMQGWRPSPGQAVPGRDGWIIERKLGEGGFGETWLAEHGRAKQRRVFKFCFDANRLRLFKRELTLSRYLRKELPDRHDVARLLEVELDCAPYYLESEYIQGGNVRDWCDQEERLAAMPLGERLRIIAEIAKAVSSAHSIPVIHNDLNPRNVLMRCGVDGKWRPVLTDFGITSIASRARLERQDAAAGGFAEDLLAQGSSRIDARAYRPPEGLASHVASVQSDIYALGVMLFQILVGDFDRSLDAGWEESLDEAAAPNFVGLSPLSESALPTSPSTENSQVAADLLHCDILACVHADPAQRLENAAQLVLRLNMIDERMRAELSRRREERGVRRARRPRVGIAASLVVLLVAVGFGASALFRRPRTETAIIKGNENPARALEIEQAASEDARKAEREAQAALTRGELSPQALNAMILDLQRSVGNLLKSSPIRQRSIDSTLARLDKLSAEFIAHPVADRELAVALQEFGDLILKLGVAPAPKPGDQAGRPAASAETSPVKSAEKLYRRSHEIFSELARANGNSPLAKRDLEVVYNKIGDVLVTLDDLDGARDAYQKGMEIATELARDETNAHARPDLWVSYNKLGDVMLNLNAFKGARDAYDKGMAIALTLARDNAGAQGQSNLWVSYNKVGDVMVESGEIKGARDRYEMGMAIALKLALDKTNVEAERDLLTSYNELGGVMVTLGDIRGAREAYEKGMVIALKLARDEPDVESQRDLSTSYNNHGDVMLKCNDLKGARDAYEKGMMIALNLARDESNPQAQCDLSVSYNKVGAVMVALGDIKGARDAYEHQMAIAQKLASNGTSLQARRVLWISNINLGDVMAKSNDLKGARDAYEKGMEIALTLGGVEASVLSQVDLWLSYIRLGDSSLNVNDLRGARDAYAKGMDIALKLAKDELNAQAQRNLAISYEKLGDVMVILNDLKGAREKYVKEMEIALKLSRDETNEEAQRDVSVSYGKLGGVMERNRDLKGALEAYEKKLEIALKLARDESNDQAQHDLFVSYNNLGDVRDSLNDLKGAREAYEKAMEIALILARDESNAQAQRDLSNSYNKLGDVRDSLNDVNGARGAYEKAMEIDLILARDESNAQGQRDLSISHERFGDLMVKTNNLTGARDAYEKGKAIRVKLARDETNAQAQRDLMVSYKKLGDVMLELKGRHPGIRVGFRILPLADVRSNRLGNVTVNANEFQDALDAYKKGMAIALRLARDESNAGAQRDLMVSYLSLGDVMINSNNLKEARSFYEKAMAIALRLASNRSNAETQSDLAQSSIQLGATLEAMGEQQIARERLNQCIRACDAFLKHFPEDPEMRGTRDSAWSLVRGTRDSARSLLQEIEDKAVRSRTIGKKK